VDDVRFEAVTLGAIVGSSLCLAVRTNNDSDMIRDILSKLNIAWVIMFAAEMVIRVVATGLVGCPPYTPRNAAFHVSFD
jgi:hypothetical protein